MAELLPHRKHHIPLHYAIGRWTLQCLDKAGANFFERLLRAKIILAGDEDNAIDKAQGVIDHQSLQLAVIETTPKGALEKCPANLDLTDRRIQIPIARAANDPSRSELDHSEGSSGLDSRIKILLKHFALVAQRVRMLLPN